MNKKHFTLIELLIVVAILAILAALLLPAMQSTLKMGQRTQCLSNVHSIGIGLISYTDDAYGRLPRIVTSALTESYSGLKVIAALSPYLGDNLPVLYCPTNRRIVYTNASSSYWGYRGKFTGERIARYLARPYNTNPLLLDTSYPSWGDGRYCNHQDGYFADGQSQWYADGHTAFILFRSAQFIGDQ